MGSVPLAGSEVDSPTLLLLAVARLGELDQAGWWRCHGLSTTGRYVLGAALPRTWQAAALKLDISSAGARHDDLLGRETALHLFSDQLPFHRVALAWLAERKTSESSPLIGRLQELDEAGVRAMVASETSGAAHGGESVGSGLLLGSLTTPELQDSEAMGAAAKALAAAYVDQGPELRPPYFDLSP